MIKQPIKNSLKKVNSSLKKDTIHKKLKPKKKIEYGTSKLEDKFAANFLDKLGVKYIRQYKAKSIGRYFDFKIIPDGPIFEVNGGYWHGDPRIYEDCELNKIQIKSKIIDEHKKKWALTHGIPIYYFWEKDINERPSFILDEIRKILHLNKSNRKDFYK